MKKVATLRPKLKNRVSWLKKRDTDDVVEMQQFSSQLEMWLAANATLEKQCETLGMDLIFPNVNIRELITESMEET